MQNEGGACGQMIGGAVDRFELSVWRRDEKVSFGVGIHKQSRERRNRSYAGGVAGYRLVFIRHLFFVIGKNLLVTPAKSPKLFDDVMQSIRNHLGNKY